MRRVHYLEERQRRNECETWAETHELCEVLADGSKLRVSQIAFIEACVAAIKRGPRPVSAEIRAHAVETAERRKRYCVTLAHIRKHYRRDRSTGYFKLVPREKAKAPSARDLRIALKLAYANLKPDCDPVVVDHIRNLAA